MTIRTGQREAVVTLSFNKSDIEDYCYRKITDAQWSEYAGGCPDDGMDAWTAAAEMLAAEFDSEFPAEECEVA